MRLIALTAVLAAGAAGQKITHPPTLVRVFHSSGTDSQTVQRYATVGAAVPVIGMTALTGTAETWFVEAQTSFASIEQLDRALQSLGPVQGEEACPIPTGDAVVPPAGAWIAAYRPGLSYRPSEAVQNLPKARYFQISFFRVRPDAESDLATLLKARKATLDSINMDRPDLAYKVISGAPSGLYFLLAPLASLETLDEVLASVPTYASGAAKEVRQLGAADNIARENRLLRVDPELSYVSNDFAGVDPDYWKPRAK